MSQEFEFRSRVIKESSDDYNYNAGHRQVEKTCNEWAAEGFEVFSVVPMPYSSSLSGDKLRVRLTAKRRLKPEGLFHKSTGRKFR